ncbi:YczE/YyaS/YitT family protein [Flindersiella endophytica]
MSANPPNVSFASSPLATLREGRLTRRFIQLYVGLVLYGASMALMVRSGLGLDPWDVFHQGVTEHTPFSFGTVVILASFVVLLAWIPLRQWPGIGTISNAIVIGLVTDAGLALLDQPKALALQIVFLVGGIVLNGVASAAYIGARLGPGPRDGLMTGLVRRTGRSVRLVRTTIEVTVLAIGWLLGGTVGVGTVLYAVGIGPLIHVLLPRLTVPPRTPDQLTVKPAEPSTAEA